MTGVQTCALPILPGEQPVVKNMRPKIAACLFLALWPFLAGARNSASPPVELASLQQPQTLVVVTEDYAPAAFVKNGEIVGFDVDIARAVFDRLGVSYQIKLVPWARAMNMLKHGEADVGLHVSFSEDRAPYLIWPRNSVWQADFAFFTNDVTDRKSVV